MAADLGSANGTYLNGDRLAGPSPVHDGDGLAFGPAAFTFRPA
jgi:pSer/pThr/pTyr-binding forkhead associated (FHA) protein